jgi:TonB-linked SusC/RagA family outer membrane protein
MKKQVRQTLLLLGLWCFAVGSLLAQKSISGKVTSSDGEPLIGISIVVKGTTKGTISDLDGKYQLDATENATLVFSFVGYATKEIPVGNNTVLDVVLDNDDKQLGEVVVTAFGIKREKKALVYAAQDVKSEDLERANEQNTISALQGKVSGALIQNSSGAPGAGATIILRGINSLDPNSDNQPLIVVDGIIISNATNVGNALPTAGSNNLGGSAEQFSNTNRLADINPNDIENVSVLKGPAATALYGSLAQNGAIIITTKKGQEGKAKVQFSTTYGVDEVNKYQQNQTKYREGSDGRIRVNPDNSVSTVRFQDFGPPITDEQTYNNFEGFFTQGSRLATNLSVSGGKKGFTYLLSGSQFNQDGVVPTTSFQRTTGRLNAGYEAFDWLTLTGSLTYSSSKNVSANGGDKSVMSALSYHSSTFDVNDYVNPNGSIKSYAGTTIDNPRWLAEFAPYTSRVGRYVAQASAEARLTSWLSVRYQLGVDQYSDIRKRIMPNVTDVGSQVGGFTIDETFLSRQINSNFLVTIQKDITEDLKGRLLVGNSVFDNKLENVGMRGEGLVIPQFYDISNARNFFPLYDFSQSRLVGTFADFSLDWKGYLFLQATGRNDWTSTLPDGNNSFFYPSVGLSFIFTEALKLPEFFTYGKIRASYAETGKGTSAYLTSRYFEAAPRLPFGADPATSIAGFRQSLVIGDPNLRPERTKGTEFGLEMRFFKNRFGFDVTFFEQKTIDQIFRVPVTNATGYSLYVTNSGAINNKGIELSANVVPVKTKGFTWDMRFNFTKMAGTVESIAEGSDRVLVFDATWVVNQLVPGGKVGDLYGFMYNRNANGQLIIDANGFPTVDRTKLQLAGNAIPDFITSLTNSFSYKGLTLSGLFEWRKGGDVYDMSLRNSIRNGIYKGTEVRHQMVVFNGVLADGTPNTKEVNLDRPAFYNNENRYTAAADMLVQDASWLRLRNVNLSYLLPKKLLQKTPFSTLSLSVIGNNLWLNTPYKGFDPEAMANGAGSNAFGFAGLTIPAVRNVSVGLNVTFK